MTAIKTRGKSKKTEEPGTPPAEKKAGTARRRKVAVTKKPAVIDLKKGEQGAPDVQPAIKVGEPEKLDYKERPELAKIEVIKAISEEAKPSPAAEPASTPAPVAAAPEKPEPGKPAGLLLAPEHKRPLNIYRKISASFVALTLLLLGVVFYFSFVKVKITIEPKTEAVRGNMLVDIYDEMVAPTKDNSLVGAVKLIDLEQEKTFNATGEKNLGEDVAGKVKIINNYNKNQPLVASTRLLTPDGKLFRIKDTVNVPANGSIEAEIYADKPGAEMATGPTRFTIPGLWAGLQDKIFAESSEAIEYKQKIQKYVLEADIENGVKELKEGLLTLASSQAGPTFENQYDQVLYEIDDNSVVAEVGAKAEEEVDQFTIKIKAKVVAVAFGDEAVEKIAKQKLISDLAEGRELAEFNEDKIAYGLNSFDVENGAAAINVDFEGTAIPKGEVGVVDKQKLVGLSAEQLNGYLAGLPTIASFQVEFQPSFIKRTPNLIDRIEIVIQSNK